MSTYTDVVVRLHDTGQLEVIVGDRTMGTASWGEVLEQVTALTHPLINPKREQYPMQTPQEWVERRDAAFADKPPRQEGGKQRFQANRLPDRNPELKN